MENLNNNYYTETRNKQIYINALDAAVEAYTRSSIFDFVFCNRKSLKKKLILAAKRSGIGQVEWLNSVAKHYNTEEKSYICHNFLAKIF